MRMESPDENSPSRQRILNLKRNQGIPTAKVRHDLRLCNLPRRRIGDADLTQLARLDQIVQRAHRLLDGRKAVASGLSQIGAVPTSFLKRAIFDS
jgi:hypothetical protein